ncbi:SAP domain-containing protein [Apilactobacillus ozensis]|uniref:SAP domain-containing protein n=1 Tax=Apilactobacillus ozensis TaxID=866801 RepID=UPI00200A12B8|nr:SAP domain-containing protein [Apilactobacillus ozensis]MCK8607231.1 SAP domain-containing protein [Apilactobacillus ozensis]
MDKLTIEEYQQKYFYKIELVQLCRRYKLPTYGTKAELNQYIIKYLSGVPAKNIKAKRCPSKKAQHLRANQITLNTKLINSGFSFNNEARQFFANYFQVDKFSFKKSMAIIKRRAELENDDTITVGDLIKKMQIVNTKATNEEHTYQWNNFVSDFCSCKQSNIFTNKLKVAAILWQHVKKSTHTKTFDAKLINQYCTEIKSFIK